MVKPTDELVSRLTGFGNKAAAARFEHSYYLGNMPLRQRIFVYEVAKSERNADTIKIGIGKGHLRRIAVNKGYFFIGYRRLYLLGSYFQHRAAEIIASNMQIPLSMAGNIDRQIAGAATKVQYFFRI